MVIADFPELAAGTDTEPTYPLGAIAQPVTAMRQAGARVAGHSTLPDAGRIVAAGVDSIEHGFGLDERAITDVASRGIAARRAGRRLTVASLRSQWTATREIRPRDNTMS